MLVGYASDQIHRFSLRSTADANPPYEDAPMVFFFLQLALPDRRRAAGGVDRLLGEREIGNLLDGRLLVLGHIADLDAVVDRPLRARRIKAGVDRPDAILGEHIE